MATKKGPRRPPRTPSPIIGGCKCFCGHLCDPEEAAQCGGHTGLPPQNFTCPQHGLFEYCCGELCVIKNIADERCCDCPMDHAIGDDGYYASHRYCDAYYCYCGAENCTNAPADSNCEHCRNGQMHWDESDGRSEHTDITHLEITHATNDTLFTADGTTVDHGLKSGSVLNWPALSTGPDGGMYFSVVCLVCKKEYEITDK